MQQKKSSSNVTGKKKQKIRKERAKIIFFQKQGLSETEIRYILGKKFEDI